MAGQSPSTWQRVNFWTAMELDGQRGRRICRLHFFAVRFIKERIKNHTQESRNMPHLMALFLCKPQRSACFISVLYYISMKYFFIFGVPISIEFELMGSFLPLSFATEQRLILTTGLPGVKMFRSSKAGPSNVAIFSSFLQTKSPKRVL